MAPTNLQMSLALTFKEAGGLAGRDARTISKAVRLGQIPTIQIGGQRLIPRNAFVRFLEDGIPFERQKVGGAA